MLTNSSVNPTIYASIKLPQRFYSTQKAVKLRIQGEIYSVNRYETKIQGRRANGPRVILFKGAWLPNCYIISTRLLLPSYNGECGLIPRRFHCLYSFLLRKVLLKTDFKLMVAQQSGKGPNLKVENSGKKGEMDLFSCMSLTTNVKLYKKINRRAQTFKFSVFIRGRLELLAKNEENKED